MKWFAAALFVAAPALAQERDYCPERPGLDTPACTIAPGKVSVETSIVDWTRDDQPGSRTDTVLIGDTLVRLGLTDTIEMRVGWTPFGHVRERSGGMIEDSNRVGDVSLGAKVNLHDPDGSGLSIAVLPYATLPVGRGPVGAGDWGAGLLVPVTWELSDTVSLDLSPEVDAAVDGDGAGRHVAYGSAAGVAIKLSEVVTLTGEAQVIRDDDPAGQTTQSLGALSIGWMAKENLQFDLLAAAGLNRDTPDAQIYAGISRRF